MNSVLLSNFSRYDRPMASFNKVSFDSKQDIPEVSCKLASTLDCLSVVLPAGAYLVGDPFRIFDSFAYEELLDSASFFKTKCVGSVRQGDKSFVVAAFEAAYGAGTYFDSKQRIYSTDSGLIAVVPEELVSLHLKEQPSSKMGNLLSFKKSFCAKYEFKTKNIFIGSLKINTAEY